MTLTHSDNLNSGTISCTLSPQVCTCIYTPCNVKRTFSRPGKPEVETVACTLKTDMASAAAHRVKHGLPNNSQTMTNKAPTFTHTKIPAKPRNTTEALKTSQNLQDNTRSSGKFWTALTALEKKPNLDACSCMPFFHAVSRDLLRTMTLICLRSRLSVC